MSSTEHKPLIAVSQVPIGGMPVQAVDGRDLHGFLGVRRDFTNWMKAQIERARLVLGRDYLLAQKGEQLPGGTKHLSVYWLALDAAKHIAMMAGTDRGFKVREYFIECERRLQGGVCRPGTVAIEPRPFWEWTQEEIRTHLSVVNAYRHTLNTGSAAWYMMAAGFPKPPARLMPVWWQTDLDLQPQERNSLTITVPLNGGAH